VHVSVFFCDVEGTISSVASMLVGLPPS